MTTEEFDLIAVGALVVILAGIAGFIIAKDFLPQRKNKK